MMRSRDPDILFSKGSILDVLENHKQKALDEIRNLSANQVMEASDERLVEHFVEKFDIAPLVLYADRAERQVHETTVETRDSFTYDIPRGGSLQLPGVRLSSRIPYSGDPGLWDITPSTYSLTAIRGELSRPGSDGIGYVTISVSHPQNQADAGRMDAAIATQLASIQDMVSNQKTNIDQYRAEMRRRIADAVRERRSRAEQMFGLAQQLNLPLNQKGDTRVIEPIRVEKRLIVQLPPPSSGQYKPQPGITDESCELILSAIRSQGRTFERTPGTFAKFDEEELRDVILANLNTHFVDRATGETFCKKGKTDIHITENDRSAFIGECKVWAGEKELQRGLHQLVSYLTWRHCKVALIVFNKDRAKFSELLEKAPQSLKGLDKLFIRVLTSNPHQGEWRMLFRSPEDDGQEIAVHLFLFNLYADTARGTS